MGKRARWLLAAPLALMVVFTGCGSDKKLPAGGGGGTTRAVFVGTKVCTECHSETAGHWGDTRHGNAMKTLTKIGQGNNKACVPCHSVGFGKPTGFVSNAQTPNLANVGCESCHGPGGEHVAGPTSANIVKNVPSETCGGCHTDAHHPTFDEFKTSKHAVSLTSLKEGGHAADKCMPCHSTEGFFFQLSQPTLNRGKQTAPPSASSAKLNMECWTCHDPHEKTANEPQLRLDKKKLCETCHRLSTASQLDAAPITSSPRHGQGLIFEGKGGLKPNGTVAGAALIGPNSAHTAGVPDGCATCHVFGVEQASPTEGNPNVTGHTFQPNLKACTQSGCHATTVREAIETGADPATIARRDAAKAQVQAALNLCKPFLDKKNAAYIDPSKLSGKNLNNYNVALWDYNMVVNMDPSMGVHNLKYDLALLETARSTFAALP